MSWLVLSSSYSESRTFSVSCSTSEQVHRKPEGRMARTGDPSPKGIFHPQMSWPVVLGETGQELLTTAQGWAGCWAVGRQQFYWESSDSLGFYFSLSFAC